MSNSRPGRIFRFGDNIDTDQLAPGQYMRGGIRAIAEHCLKSVRPDFAASVKVGDLVIGGRNFGVGSSREQAAEALKYLGVQAVIAPSFAGIFYRNAINLGLPVLVAQVPEQISDGDYATLDLENSQLLCSAHGLTVELEPLPENLARLLTDGGLVPHLKKRFADTNNGISLKRKIHPVPPFAKEGTLQLNHALSGGPPTLKKGERGGFKAVDQEKEA